MADFSTSERHARTQGNAQRSRRPAHWALRAISALIGLLGFAAFELARRDGGDPTARMLGIAIVGLLVLVVIGGAVALWTRHGR